MPASTDIAAILGSMDQSMRERQRVAENTEERAFRIGMAQWQETANAQLQQQQEEQRAALDVYKGYEAAKLQREKELSDLGDLTDVLAKDVKEVSPELDKLLTNTASRISGEFQTLSGMQAKHMEVMNNIQQRANVSATRISAMNQAVGAYNAGKTDLPTIDYILQKSAGMPQGAEGTAGWIEKRRVSTEEFNSAIKDMLSNEAVTPEQKAKLANPAYLKGVQAAIGGVEDTRIKQESELRNIMSKEMYYETMKSGSDLERWFQNIRAAADVYQTGQPKETKVKVKVGWTDDGKPIYEDKVVLAGGSPEIAKAGADAIAILMKERFGIEPTQPAKPSTALTGKEPWNVEVIHQIQQAASSGDPTAIERAKTLDIPTYDEIADLLSAIHDGLELTNAPASMVDSGVRALAKIRKYQDMGLVDKNIELPELPKPELSILDKIAIGVGSVVPKSVNSGGGGF